jgi:hypothetical protein
MNNMIMVLETSAPPQGSGAGTARGSGMARVESSRYYETGSQIAEERRDDELGRFLFEKKKIWQICCRSTHRSCGFLHFPLPITIMPATGEVSMPFYTRHTLRK